MSQNETLFAPLPAHARVWVYQAGREMTDQEVTAARQVLRAFVQTWDSHGQPLAAAAEVLHARFVVLAVDQEDQAPSGCSIDKSVAVIRQLEQQLGTSLLDRGQVAYVAANGDLATVALPQLKAAVAAGELGPDTLVFNPLVADLGQLRTQFVVPAARTWLARYFAKATA
jgi:hypothetical protein